MAYRCLIATCQTWASTAALPALVARAGAVVTSFSPGPLGLASDVSERLRCSRVPRDAAAALHALLRNRVFDYVIVGDELLLGALYERSDVGAIAALLPVDPADTEAVALALSKFAFAERADALGLNVPRFGFATSASEAVDRAAEFGFPVIVKGDRGFAGSHVRVCGDADAVRSSGGELLATHARILVQRHVGGPAVSACVLYDRGRVAAYKAYRAECSHPDAFSASTVHAFFEHEGIEATARTLGDATGFHGMAGIDFILEGSELHVLEINPRPTMGFTGTTANRSFFAPVFRRLLERELIPCALAYDGQQTTAVYFPGYLFYVAHNLTRWKSLSWSRFFSALRAARVRDAKLIAWELARFMYDTIVRSIPTSSRAAGTRAPSFAGPTSPIASHDRARVTP